MDFQIIDIVLIAITLFLAIKGLVNGFSKELFNFLGLIGGIAVAARINDIVADMILKQGILPESMVQYKTVIGFVAVFVIIWIIFSIISSIFESFSSDEIGIISRFFGYLIGVVRYASILALIIFAFNNSTFLKEKLTSYTQKSQLFEPMFEVAKNILNSDNNLTIILDSNSTTIDTNSTNSTINAIAINLSK